MMNPNRSALALGLLLATWHLIWALLVLLGLAQPLLDLVFRLHFIAPPYQVTTFSVGPALGLILLTFVFGYALGWLFGWFWNHVSKKK